MSQLPPTESVEDFCRRVVALLATPPPPNPQPLPPPADRGSHPDLLVYWGAADSARLAATRAQVPGATFLFWLFPAEPAEAAASLLAAPAPGRTLLCPAVDAWFFEEKLGALIQMLPRRNIRLTVQHGLEQQLPEPAARIPAAIKSALENVNQDRGRGLVRLRCSIRNLPLMLRDAAWRPGRVPPGSDAIICGAGPSLSASLAGLRAVRGRATLIAVGHAVPTLLAAGIQPDAVVEDDAYAGRNWPDPPAPIDSLLVASTEVAPDVARRFPRILWTNGSSFAFNTVAAHLGLGLLDATLNRTVTVHAIDFAVRAGFRRMALVAQDFCIADDGRLYAEGGAIGAGDQLVEAPGNAGRPVRATASLQGLREALENYLQLLARKFAGHADLPDIFNATAGGAIIAGTQRTSLDDFMIAAPTGSPPAPLALETATTRPPAERVSLLARELETSRAHNQAIVDTLRRLQRALGDYPLDMETVSRAQASLRTAMAAEQQAREQARAAPWLNTLHLHADLVLKEVPAPPARPDDAAATVDLLHRRYRFVADLAADLARDLQRAAQATAAPGPAPAPFAFTAFRNLNLETIRRTNPALADDLADLAPAADNGDDFRIRWMNQVVPYVEKKTGPDAWQPLSSFLGMFQDAQQFVRQFAESNALDPSRHAIIHLAPGNWVYVCEAARLFPQTPAMVLEPWPRLLAALMPRGCFAHRLPPDTLVLDVSPANSAWLKQAAERMATWRARDITPLVCLPPYAAQLTEVQAIAAQLARCAKA